MAAFDGCFKEVNDPLSFVGVIEDALGGLDAQSGSCPPPECLSMSSSAADPRRTSSAQFAKCLSPTILRSFALAVSDGSEAKGE